MFYKNGSSSLQVNLLGLLITDEKLQRLKTLQILDINEILLPLQENDLLKIKKAAKVHLTTFPVPLL